MDTIDTVYDFRGNYLHFDGRSGQYYFHSDSNLYIFNSIISYGIEYGYSYHFERVGGSKWKEWLFVFVLFENVVFSQSVNYIYNSKGDKVYFHTTHTLNLQNLVAGR